MCIFDCLSRKDWKKLRNKYLDMQRKCRREKVISSLMRRNHQQAEGDRRPHFRQPKSANYEPILEPSDDFVQEETVVVVVEPCAEPFEPGLIVKIVLNEPISDAKRFKSQVRSREEVSYVEAEDFNQVSFVRCVDAGAARRLVEQNIWSQSEILQGNYRPLQIHQLIEKRYLYIYMYIV